MKIPTRPRALLIGSIVALASLVAVPARAQDRTTRVTGVVRDDVNGIPLPGVPVERVGTSEVVYTDVDGRYEIVLPPGEHTLRVSMDNYQPVTVMVSASGERTLTADVGVAPARFADTVQVTAEAVTAEVSSAAAALVERSRSQLITDNIGGQEMKQNADSDAAEAMQRVTGLSVVDKSYVFVRGLGERYSNTTLSGSVIPSVEPDKKVVPLDIFPSGLLSSVSVAKSYTPDRSAEFAGGLVEIVPLKFPSQPVLDVSYSIGFNSITTGKDVLDYHGGESDWRGFDDGIRSLPGAVPSDEKVIRGGIYTPDVGVLRSELAPIGRSFPDIWNILGDSGKPNQSGSATFGQRFGKAGVLLSYSQSYEEQYNTEKQIFYRTSAAGLSEFSNYDFVYATTRANVGWVANFSLQFNPNQRIRWENFYTRTGKDETRTFEGFNSDIATNIRNQRLFWAEERLFTSGLAGEHFFRRMGNSRIDWRATWADANRDEPDLREVLYEQNGPVFVLANQSQSGFRMFNTLADDTQDAVVNWSLFGNLGGRPSQFKAGFQYINRTRDFTSRQFRFVPVDTAGVDLTAQPETLFAAENIGPHFEIREQTRTTDTYAAEQTTASIYGMVDIALNARSRIVGGVRVEDFDQTVDTYDLFDFEGDPVPIRSQITETEIFPSINFIFSPRPSHNLRLSFSQTVNRPEFRELAPFEFTDITGGRAVVGNPDLQRSLIQNYDVRYEVFPRAEEVLAVSFFYKHFDSPIERIVEPTAQLRTSFTNAESARNLGLELEARRSIGEHFVLGANYTFVDSSITLTPAAAQVQTSLERPLAGQSENLFNISGEVRHEAASVRVLYNFYGERISDVGSLGLPDIYEDGRGTLDIVFSYRLRNRLTLRFSADNLTNAETRSSQGGLLQQSYFLGRTFTFGVGFSAF
jgi:outer membrane receptor protein involved in Fe transport